MFEWLSIFNAVMAAIKHVKDIAMGLWNMRFLGRKKQQLPAIMHAEPNTAGSVSAPPRRRENPCPFCTQGELLVKEISTKGGYLMPVPFYQCNHCRKKISGPDLKAHRKIIA